MFQYPPKLFLQRGISEVEEIRRAMCKCGGCAAFSSHTFGHFCPLLLVFNPKYELAFCISFFLSGVINGIKG